MDISFYIIIAAIVGARLYFVLQHWGKPYMHDLGQALQIWDGGLVFYGGFLGGLIAVLIYIKAKKVSLLAFMDILAPATALGYAITRIGCFVNGCCYGARVRFALGCGLSRCACLLRAKLPGIFECAANLPGGDLLLDLYSGLRALMPLAGRYSRIIGIETDSEAVADGNHLAEALGIGNVELLPGRLEDSACPTSRLPTPTPRWWTRPAPAWNRRRWRRW